MWPWGHLAAGYLCYSAYCRLVADRSPGEVPTPAALLGTQAPDLVDKPLAWTLSILPSGRSLGHSLVVAAVALPLLWWVAARRDARPLAAAFSLGYLMHLLTDALYPLFALDVDSLTFLAWPLVPQPIYDEKYGILAYFLTLEPTPELAFEFFLAVVAAAVWHADGRPGLSTVRKTVNS
jgi:hypothetical protein